MAIVFAIEGKPIEYVAFCVWLGAFFDFFDGLAARLLKVSGDFGKQLDSLADMVTFGVSPFLTLFYLLKNESAYINLLPILIVVCSAWRLAKFNIDSRQSLGFLGLPTPANALFFTALPFAISYFEINPPVYVYIIGICFFSFLMVSEISMQSLKFKSFKLNDNIIKIGLIVPCVMILTILGFAGISLAILFYILYSSAIFYVNKIR